MTKVDDFLTILCRDFDFSYGGMDNKRSIVERLLKIADLQIVPIEDTGHSEHDPGVVARAQNAADKPYDQATCARYPWAAAARIRHLEAVIAEFWRRQR